MSKKSEIIENHIIKLNETLETIRKSLEYRMTCIEEKLELIMKRQSDIEDKILFRIEKNTSTQSTSSSNIDTDSKMIILKDKDETIKKTRKKTISSAIHNDQINKRGDIVMKVYNDIILLTGQTYDRKELIKQYKGRWDNKNNGWTVPLENRDKLRIDLEKYSESLNYEEIEEVLNKDEIKTIKKIEMNKPMTTFNTCQIIDSDDEDD